MQRSSPSATGKPSTYEKMQKPHVTSLATKHSEVEKTKFCGYLSICQVHNASLATKANEVHHQPESLEAPKRAKQGGNNTSSGHCGPHIQQKWDHGPQHEQQHAKTHGLDEETGLVTSRMSTQIHTREKKAPEPRKHTKQLPQQRAAPKSRATYHHGPSLEHQNSVNSK